MNDREVTRMQQILLDKLDLERCLFLLGRATRVGGTWELSEMIFQLVGNETEAFLRSNPIIKLAVGGKLFADTWRRTSWEMSACSNPSEMKT